MLKIPEYYYDQTFQPFQEMIVGTSQSQTFPAKETLINVGEYMDKTFYIHQGVLKFSILSANGKEKTCWFIGPGGLFSLYSPLERHYREERDELIVKAQTDVIVTTVSQSKIANLFDHHPEFAKTMLRQYADFSSILLYDVINLASQDNLTKVCTYLYQYERLLKPHQIILTQEEMAINIGISLLNFSRCLQKLRQQGIIATGRKQIEILNWPKVSTP